MADNDIHVTYIICIHVHKLHTYQLVHTYIHYIIVGHVKWKVLRKIEFSLLFLVPQLLSVSWWWQKSRGRVHHFPARYRTSTTSRRRSPAISVTCHFHLPGPVGRSAAPLRLDPPSHTAIIRSHADGIAQQDITNAGTRPGARLN